MNCQTRESSNMPRCKDALAGMPLAMAYVPWQPAFCDTFPLCRALQTGTIFPELCKPFCGRRGGR
ncbi:MAG: spore coat associated protein CotJA [Marvinbryantia sp.]|uniref:spore coat associated protein CotJA n=1 Tax=Marvinbryantia sp. TaxID=2496532 RepID=UPI00399B9838